VNKNTQSQPEREEISTSINYGELIKNFEKYLPKNPADKQKKML